MTPSAVFPAVTKISTTKITEGRRGRHLRVLESSCSRSAAFRVAEPSARQAAPPEVLVQFSRAGDGAPRQRSRPAVPEQTAADALPGAESSSPTHPLRGPQTAPRRYRSCAHLSRACEDVPSRLRPAAQSGAVLWASCPFL